MTTNFKKIRTLKTVCLGKVNRFADDETTVKDGVNAPLITKDTDVFLYNYYGYVLNPKHPHGFKDSEIYKCHFDISKKECAALKSIDLTKGIIEYFKVPILTIDCPGEWFHIARDVDDEMFTVMRNNYCLVTNYVFKGHSYLDNEHVYVFDFNYLNPVKNPYKTVEGVQAYGRTVLAPYLDDDYD